MKKTVLCLLIVSLLASMLAGCECKHEWVDATCLDAKVCAKCAATEGAPLGHSWTEANCLDAKTCTRCGAVEGTALGHSWMAATCGSAKKCKNCAAEEGEPLEHDWLEATCGSAKKCQLCGVEEGSPLEHTPATKDVVDIIGCTKHQEDYCEQCGHILEVGPDEQITSLVTDEMFVFSPRDFMERMKMIAAEHCSSFSYKITGDRVSVYLGDTNKADAYIRFYSDTNEYAEDMEQPGIWCVEVRADQGSAEDYGSLISSDILTILYLTCDPQLTIDDYEEIAMAKVVSAANALYYGDFFGYYERNGLLYEFMHVAMDGMAIEAILVYAANWIA